VQMARSYDPPKLASHFWQKRTIGGHGRLLWLARRRQPTRAIAWPEPHGGSPPPSLVLSFYHALWPPAMVQSFSETPSLHHAVDVHGATGCMSRLRSSGLVARVSACDCRPSYVCRPRQPLRTYAKPLSAIRHRLPSCRRRWACRLEQSQTLIPGGVGAAAASLVASQAAGWRHEAGKGLLQL